MISHLLIIIKKGKIKILNHIYMKYKINKFKIYIMIVKVGNFANYMIYLYNVFKLEQNVLMEVIGNQ
jgi:hypothetical protein